MPHSANTHSCSEFRELTRRQALLSGALGLSLPALLAVRSRAADTRAASPGGTFGRAKRAIILYLHGGHPQQE
ncbi:MAG: hypothetical protein KDA79_24185, partial [Planctomycetaceae bacterium]|nr:hypothetical protein [Planctomycetaceae bacterium]